MPTAPQAATLVPSTGTVQWSNGELFDGYLVAGIALPTYGGGTVYPYVTVEGAPAPLRIPQWSKIPIVAGVIDQGSQLLLNSSIQPPNSRYAFFFYDVTGRQVAADATLYNVNSTTFTVTIPALTAPSIAGAAPTPES